jgi:transitional endoplasmic reticulum ATPase
MGLLLRAKVRERRREHREARKDYERAVALDPALADTALWDALGGRKDPPEEEGDAAEAKKDEAVTFAQVGGLEDLKERIRMRIVHPFQRPELFKAYGKKVGGGVLFYGPPGCGKTFLARATAGECGAHFMAVGAARGARHVDRQLRAPAPRPLRRGPAPRARRCSSSTRSTPSGCSARSW